MCSGAYQANPSSSYSPTGAFMGGNSPSNNWSYNQESGIRAPLPNPAKAPALLDTGVRSGFGNLDYQSSTWQAPKLVNGQFASDADRQAFIKALNAYADYQKTAPWNQPTNQDAMATASAAGKWGQEHGFYHPPAGSGGGFLGSSLDFLGNSALTLATLPPVMAAAGVAGLQGLGVLGSGADAAASGAGTGAQLGAAGTGVNTAGSIAPITITGGTPATEGVLASGMPAAMATPTGTIAGDSALMGSGALGTGGLASTGYSTLGGTGATLGSNLASDASAATSAVPTATSGGIFGPAGWGTAALGLGNSLYQSSQDRSLANQIAQQGNSLNQPQRQPYQNLLQSYFTGGQDITKQPIYSNALALANRNSMAQALAGQNQGNIGGLAQAFNRNASEIFNANALPYLQQLAGQAGFGFPANSNAATSSAQFGQAGNNQVALGLQNLFNNIDIGSTQAGNNNGNTNTNTTYGALRNLFNTA